MSGRPSIGRRSGAIAVITGLIGLAGMTMAYAHDPHQGAVTVTWDTIHLKGQREAVYHTVGNYTYESSGTSWWSHTHQMRAEIFFAKRDCTVGICTWNTIGDSQNEGTSDSVNSGTLQGIVAPDCDWHKFYSKHKTFDHGNGAFHQIDENQGVEVIALDVNGLGCSGGT